MSLKLLWTGATLILAVSHFVSSDLIVAVGAVIMIIGIVLFWLDK